MISRYFPALLLLVSLMGCRQAGTEKAGTTTAVSDSNINGHRKKNGWGTRFKKHIQG